MVNGEFREAVDFFPKAHQPGRGVFRIEEFARLGFEQHYADRKAALASLFGKSLDDRPVTKVYPIKISDGGDAAIRGEVRGLKAEGKSHWGGSGSPGQQHMPWSKSEQ